MAVVKYNELVKARAAHILTLHKWDIHDISIAIERTREFINDYRSVTKVPDEFYIKHLEEELGKVRLSTPPND